MNLYWYECSWIRISIMEYDNLLQELDPLVDNFFEFDLVLKLICSLFNFAIQQSKHI